MADLTRSSCQTKSEDILLLEDEPISQFINSFSQTFGREVLLLVSVFVGQEGMKEFGFLWIEGQEFLHLHIIDGAAFFGLQFVGGRRDHFGQVEIAEEGEGENGSKMRRPIVLKEAQMSGYPHILTIRIGAINCRELDDTASFDRIAVFSIAFNHLKHLPIS